MKRIAIFAHYSTDNKIDDYVIFYLKELKKVAESIIFVSDTNIEEEELDKIKEYTIKSIAKKHGEYDFGSYKIGYLYALNNKLLSEYEELIFANDSCYAPLFPFTDMFNEMSNKKLDFWGASQNGWRNKYSNIPPHIQSFFIVFKRNVFLSDYFEKCIKLNCEPKEASNWITTRLLGYLNKNDIKIKDIYMTPEMLTEICNSVKTGKISSQQAKEVFTLVLEENKSPEEIIKEKGFVQNSNEAEIIKIKQKVLDDNTEAVNDYKNGKTNIMGYLVGQVLKASQGKFNPGLTAKLLNEEINKR